jgi:hypothetical protein
MTITGIKIKNHLLLLLIFILTVSGNTAICQPDSVYIKNVRQYISYIDSLTRLKKMPNNLAETVAEGPVTVEEFLISKDNRDTLPKKKILGGYGKYTIQNRRGDTVYKIYYHDNIDMNLFETYYFRNNNLIGAKIELQDEGIGNTIFSKEEYYKNSKIVFSSSTKNNLSERYQKRVEISLLETGAKFLTEFKKGI